MQRLVDYYSYYFGKELFQGMSTETFPTTWDLFGFITFLK